MFSIRELEDQFDELDYVVESEKDNNSSFNSKLSEVYKSKRYYFIEELNINVYEAYCISHNVEYDEGYVDFDFYIFYDLNNQHILYEEHGSALEVCLWNYINSTNKLKHKDINYIENDLKCYIKYLD